MHKTAGFVSGKFAECHGNYMFTLKNKPQSSRFLFLTGEIMKNTLKFAIFLVAACAHIHSATAQIA
ncbi:MAG: hypothetical protein WBK51_10425 [Polaromonas sp.]